MRARSATMLHDLYEAVEDDEALSVLASTVAKLCGARSANVLYIPPADAPFHQISYFPEDYVPVYLERFVAKDPWRRHALALGIQHRAVPMDDYLPPEEFVRTEMFNELFKPMGDDTGRCMGIDACADGAQLHLAVHRPQSGAPFSMEDCARLEETFRHVARVMHLRLLLSGHRTLREHHETMIEVSQAAVIIVDERMRILAASPAAVECLDSCDGICVSEGRLRIVPSTTGTAVREAVRALIARMPTRHVSFICTRSSGRPSYRLFLSPADRDPAAGVAITIDDPCSRLKSRKLSLLADAYRFTPAETQLAKRLLEGSSLEAIATSRGVGIETVRTQLKSIFHKTGTRRQVDLAALLS